MVLRQCGVSDVVALRSRQRTEYARANPQACVGGACRPRVVALLFMGISWGVVRSGDALLFDRVDLRCRGWVGDGGAGLARACQMYSAKVTRPTIQRRVGGGVICCFAH